MLLMSEIDDCHAEHLVGGGIGLPTVNVNAPVNVSPVFPSIQVVGQNLSQINVVAAVFLGKGTVNTFNGGSLNSLLVSRVK